MDNSALKPEGTGVIGGKVYKGTTRRIKTRQIRVELAFQLRECEIPLYWTSNTVLILALSSDSKVQMRAGPSVQASSLKPLSWPEPHPTDFAVWQGLDVIHCLRHWPGFPVQLSLFQALARSGCYNLD